MRKKVFHKDIVQDHTVNDTRFGGKWAMFEVRPVKNSDVAEILRRAADEFETERKIQKGQIALKALNTVRDHSTENVR